VGHALGGTLAGWLAQGSGGGDARRPARFSGWLGAGAPWLRQVLVFGLLGIAPDLDFLLGLHSRYTHSIGMAMLVGLVAWRASAQFRWGLAALAAYGSHILLDWLSNDTTAPIGIMALWPFRAGFYQSNLHVFMAVSRRYWLPGFVLHNLTAVAWELVLLGPPTLLVWWWRRRRPAL
jgi:inner membrane protein